MLYCNRVFFIHNILFLCKILRLQGCCESVCVDHAHKYSVTYLFARYNFIYQMPMYQRDKLKFCQIQTCAKTIIRYATTNCLRVILLL